MRLSQKHKQTLKLHEYLLFFFICAAVSYFPNRKSSRAIPAELVHTLSDNVSDWPLHVFHLIYFSN